MCMKSARSCSLKSAGEFFDVLFGYLRSDIIDVRPVTPATDRGRMPHIDKERVEGGPALEVLFVPHSDTVGYSSSASRAMKIAARRHTPNLRRDARVPGALGWPRAPL
jgi:hypothetical protein